MSRGLQGATLRAPGGNEQWFNIVQTKTSALVCDSQTARWGSGIQNGFSWNSQAVALSASSGYFHMVWSRPWKLKCTSHWSQCSQSSLFASLNGVWVVSLTTLLYPTWISSVADPHRSHFQEPNVLTEALRIVETSPMSSCCDTGMEVIKVS